MDINLTYPFFLVIGNFLQDISLNEVIKWYGIVCLACLPFSILTFIYIVKKRPDIVGKFDKAIDKFVGTENKKEDEEKKQNVKEQEKPDKPSEEQENESMGIPNMILKIGDRYQCHLSAKNSLDVGNDRTWTVNHPFIAEISPNRGIFEAKRAGKCYIECNSELHIRIYHAQIIPKHEDWFAAYSLGTLMSGSDKATVKVGEIAKKMVFCNDEKHMMRYMYPNGFLDYHWDGEGKIDAVLYRLDDDRYAARDIEEGLNEYMEKLDLKNESPATYWIHQCDMECDDPGSVDFVAFTKKSARGQIYFGAARCWRQGAEKSEILENTEMIERAFTSMIDPEDIPKNVGARIKKEKKTQRPVRTTRVKTETKPSVAEPSEVSEDTTSQNEEEQYTAEQDPGEPYEYYEDGEPEDFGEVDVTEN